MKKSLIGVAAAVAVLAVLAQVLPDVRRYLRMRRM
ncbi:DUF6893 family small protein [Streptomyces sp. NPDC055254]